MGEKMTLTLGQVQDLLREAANERYAIGPTMSARLADALDAHLTQPAQAVDVEKVREERDSQQRAAIAAIDRAERAEALLLEAIGWNWLDDDAPQQAGVNEDNPSVLDQLYLRITAHLSENSRG